jgi:hypothetical protein
MEQPELADALEAGIAVLERFVRGIPEDRLHRRRGERAWTVYEHLAHLAVVQPVMARRLRQFVREERPVIAPFNPDDSPRSGREARRPVGELLSAFREWRTRQVETVRSAGPEVWTRTGVHPEYDAYTFEILARHILAHDGAHLYRMEELWLATDAALGPG